MQLAGKSLDKIPPHAASRAPALQRLFSRIGDMSNLAGNAQQIISLTRDSSSLEELQDLVRTEPSVVAQILRRVNSPYYRLDTEVHDLEAAAHLLGFRELVNVALVVYLSRMFSPPMSFGTFSMGGLWRHSVAVGAASQLIARVCGKGTPTEAFLAGLLHDIGLLLCCRQMRRRFMQVVEQVKGRTTTPFVEHQIYSFDHAQLGAFVAQQWELADPVVHAIAHHHDVERYTGGHTEIVYIVAAANYFCSRAGWSSLGVHNVPLPADDTYRILALDQVALSVIWHELNATIERASCLAEI